jgi:hypothetical protein
MDGAQAPGAGSFDYIPFYCEENIWRLLSRPEFAGRRAWAVAVFGRGPPVVLARQRLGRGAGGLVAWDYHVVALNAGPAAAGATVLDFDTGLGFESPAAGYLDATFPALGRGAENVLFRLMPAAEYVLRFLSDRSHMRRADGSWVAPPPPWPHPAGCGAESWTLSAILSAPPPGEGDRGPGLLVGLAGLRRFLRDLEGR